LREAVASAAGRVAGAAVRAPLPLATLADAVPGPVCLRLRALAAPGAERLPVRTVRRLAGQLVIAGDVGRAEQLLRGARRVRPGEVLLAYDLARLLERQEPPRWTEALACYEAMRAVRPEMTARMVHALDELGRFREALELAKEAVRLRPDDAERRYSLGSLLDRRGRLREAEAAYREAIRLQPDFIEAQGNLGNVLYRLGRNPEAEAAYRAALRLRPGLPDAHYNLGRALNRQDRFPEAEAAFREALRLRPAYPEAHDNLGIALFGRGLWKEAEAAYRKALRLQPADPITTYHLGNVLFEQGRDPEAEAAFREALRLRPDFPEAYCNLGDVLKRQRRFAEAAVCYRRGHELGSKQPGWAYPSAHWVQVAERMVALDARLAAFLAGRVAVSPEEQAALAWFCLEGRRQPAVAAGLYAGAFGRDGRLASDSLAGAPHRYNAACSAALAAAGRGPDAERLPAKARTALRRLALGWLRADLAGWAATLGNESARPKLRQLVRHLRQDPDLAGVRDPAALAQLPGAERAAWGDLWADADGLLKRAE
jgi:Flp pilus assembly protein TadD